MQGPGQVLALEKQVTREASQPDATVVFWSPAGCPALLAPRSYPTPPRVPVLNYTLVVIYKNNKIPTNICAHVDTYAYTLQPGRAYRLGVQQVLCFHLLFKCPPTGRIHESKSWVGTVWQIEVTRPASDPHLTGQSVTGGPGRVG